MSFEHVQAQQHVHWLVLENGETSCQIIALDLNLYHVDPADYFLDAHTFRNTRPSCVYQTHNITPFGATTGHNCCLSTLNIAAK